jgi:hypothetical protein
MESGDTRMFGSVEMTLLYEQFPGLWMVCETDNPNAQPRLICVQDLKETK